jgi:eukaryotic-like serine/threonine-protein kinase
VTDNERRRRIEELCDGALERDANDRAAFVRTACGSDVALRQEVESLLAHARAAEEFLVTPMAEVAAHVLEVSPGGALVGRQIGAYRILSVLGSGGLGEVYRARDMKLERDVAIKVVADAFLSSPERLARFEREAQVLATLNHPNIGAIYGWEESDDVRGIVLELVEGTTLAEQLALHPLPIQEALTGAGQIAEALEAAHEKGIVHRDLKPANIKLTHDGLVKVLDFGLAKVFAPEDVVVDAGHAAPITNDGTVDGVIAGTASYMSPEQARGKKVDKRTDIWAFGCVLFEMLTARPAFSGETASDTIAAIIERQPDWTSVPAQTPASIRRLLERCLEKDPKRRLRDIGDAGLEIEEALEAMMSSRGALASDHERIDRTTKAESATAGRLARWTVVGASLLAMGGMAAWQLQRSEFFWRDPLESAKATLLTDFEGAEHHAAISRDGNVVAFLSDRDGTWDAWTSQLGTWGPITLRTAP